MSKKTLLSTVLLLLFVSTTFAQSPINITLVEDPWPPYIEGKAGAPATGGTLIKLYKKVFQQLDGVNVNYLLMPWQRALIEVEQGKRDGIMALFKTPERAKVMDFTVPIFTGRTMLWYSSEKFPNGLSWNKIEDLAPHHIIMLRGSAMAKPLVDAKTDGVPLTITEINTHKQQFEMISLGRGDITVLTEIVGYHYLNTSKSDKHIIPMQKPLSDGDVYYMAFSKKSPARKLIPQINTVIESMQASGELNKILQGQSH